MTYPLPPRTTAGKSFLSRKLLIKMQIFGDKKKAPITKIRSAVRFFGTFQGKKLFISN
jgi:hypothetical protein